MVRISIKPGYKTNESKIPNLINKTGLAKRLVPKRFFISTKLLLETKLSRYMYLFSTLEDLNLNKMNTNKKIKSFSQNF